MINTIAAIIFDMRIVLSMTRPGLAFFATSEPTRRCIRKCLRLSQSLDFGFKELAGTR